MEGFGFDGSLLLPGLLGSDEDRPEEALEELLEEIDGLPEGLDERPEDDEELEPSGEVWKKEMFEC